MAGHSKWANIKHRKAAQDKRRGKLWTKLIREVTVAAREGNSADPSACAPLRLAVDKALAANMPKDTIEKACKRGAGETGAANYQNIRYEGYGQNGVAILVECMTDNRNRTAAAVRHAFSKYGGSLGTDGSVAYLFARISLLCYPPGSNAEQILETALDYQAEEVLVNDDGSVEVIANSNDFLSLREGMQKNDLPPAFDEVTMRASVEVSLNEEKARSVLNLIDDLESLDDVMQVYSNLTVTQDSSPA